MRASHNLAAVSTSYDEDNLVPNAGLVAPALLAQRLGVAELIDERVDLGARVGAANGGAKAMTVVGTALAGGDHIEHVDVLRAGAAGEVFDDTRAASAIGTWLRGFSWAAVRMLDAVLRVVLERAWAAGLGPDLDADLTIDCDSTLCQTFGLKKQGGVFGYKKHRGYHPVLATLANTGEVLHARLRGGNAASGRGAGSFIAETISRVRAAGARGAVLVRADSGFYARAFVGACRRAGARFSVTVRMNKSIRAAIDALPDSAWTPIPYWLDGGADVAETTYTAFADKRKDAVDCRLVVRRVRPTPGSQLALDVVFSHHAFITDRDGALLEVEADHRRHAVVEQVIADLKGHAGLAHLPSGRFAANAAWLALITLAYNLGRWTLRAADGGWERVTTATLRTCLIAVPPGSCTADAACTCACRATGRGATPSKTRSPRCGSCPRPADPDPRRPRPPRPHPQPPGPHPGARRPRNAAEQHQFQRSDEKPARGTSSGGRNTCDLNPSVHQGLASREHLHYSFKGGFAATRDEEKGGRRGRR